ARRGPLRERLGAWQTLVQAVQEERPDLVLSPDSRLDQLGLLPVIKDPDRHLLWENLQPEGAPPHSLADLMDAQLASRLGLPASPPMLPRLGFDPATSVVAQRL